MSKKKEFKGVEYDALKELLQDQKAAIEADQEEALIKIQVEIGKLPERAKWMSLQEYLTTQDQWLVGQSDKFVVVWMGLFKAMIWVIYVAAFVAQYLHNQPSGGHCSQRM